MATTQMQPSDKQAQQPAFVVAILKAESAFLKVYGENNPEARNAWVRESMFAMQIVKGSEYLQKCTLDSIKNSVINVALTGATLNPARRHADLVPRNVKVKVNGRDQYENHACLDFRYGGLIDIAVNSGAALSLNAYVVYSWDEFSYDVGRDPQVQYRPSMRPVDDQGNPIDPDTIAKDPKLIWKYLVCAVSRAVLPSGVVDWVVLPAWKLMKTMETSKTKNVWTAWPEEQIRKTAIKYHTKTLQGYHQSVKLATAVAIQNDLDGIETDTPKGRDTGAELEKRFNFAPQDAPQPQAEASAPPEEKPTAEGLSGARLALYEKVGEMAAGDIIEMNTILANLSGKKINGKEDLLKADDATIRELINKVTGGKK